MSFRLKTVLGIAFIEGVLLLLLVYTCVDYLKRSNETEISKHANAIVTLFAAATKDAVISTDLSTLRVLANELLVQTQVLYVNIYDNNNLLVGLGIDKNIETDDMSILDDGVLDVEADIVESGYHLGHIEMGIGEHEFDEFLVSATTRFLSIAGLEMVLVALFSWLLGHYLTRNLSELEMASNRILQGETGIQIPVTGTDEIGQTTRAFNRMIEKVERNTQDLEGVNTRLNTILSAAIDGYIIIDIDGEIKQVNPAISRLFGYVTQDIIGENVSIFMPSDQHHMDNAFLKHFIEGKHEPFQRKELMAQHQDGSLFPIELSVSKMVIDDEVILLGLVKDFSDIKRKEIAAQRTESILLATLEASQDALITIDTMGRIQEFNHAASQLFKHESHAVLGTLLGDLIFDGKERVAFNQGLEEFRLTGIAPAIKERIQLMAVKSDGNTLPIEMKVIPVQLGDETLLTAFIHDISRRIEYESQLKQSKEEAESGSKAKSRFLATMSHEIRSPLNAVLGSVELMLDSNLNKEQRIYAHTAKEAGTTLLSTLNDVLDFSKIEAGQMVLENVSFSPAKLVSQVMQILAPKATDKGVNLATFINRNVPEMVKGDKQRLRQVLQNLIDNAIKFSDSGCVSVEMWIPDSHHQEVQLYCTVKDEGIGVSLSSQEKLFQEFSQVHDQHNTHYKGTGLGLAICAELITMMGGKIELSSRLGHGCCFRFDVLLQLEERELTHFHQLPSHSRVLLVHPDNTFVSLVRKQYSQYGVQSASLNHVTDILNSDSAKGRFNLILIDDSCLPNLTLKLTETIKRDVLFEEGLLALLVSGLSPDMSVNVSEIGIEQVINKPLSREMLLGLLSKEPIKSVEASTDDILFPDAGVKNKRLLLAEDSLSNQLVAGTMLTKSGFEVEFAHNGVEAVDMAAKKKYGLILMDMRMPEMDGVEATRLILSQAPDTIILAMTANVQQEDIDSCLLVGMKDFVPKPVNKTDLVKAVNLWLPVDDKQGDVIEDEPCENEVKSCELLDVDLSCKDTHLDNSLIVIQGGSGQSLMMDNQDLFDETVISELFDMLGQESIEEMYCVYLEETTERLNTLKRLMETCNYSEIDNQAHTLKSSSGSFGAQALYEVAKSLEKSAREKDEKTLELHFTAVQQIGALTIKAFKDRFTV
ncbi:PAS domain S-box protein [Shewanella sp. VB17]|uniref:PAS domain S-box protein n=1 Tax=Shewanella sp. VB17 TaxID=2739432 RepID=UPI001566F643|nr:PAS domain S-box protein [Shewanella sp. VB17]NRD74659.1 PAS domain S-box protein [Shewanella sp. VB17]